MKSMAATLLCAVAVGVGACACLTATAEAQPPAFGTEGSAAGQFIEPRGVAVEQETGDVYVADRNNKRVEKFGPDGEFLLAWGWGVADGTTSALQTCTTTCFAGLEGAGAGEFSNAEGVAVDDGLLSPSRGDVYVIDAANNRVQKFGPEGEFVLMFGGEVNATTKGDVCIAGESCQAGTAGTGAGEFERLNGRSIAVDATGIVFVGDENRVQRFGEGGAAEGEVALPGVGFIENLAVDSAKDMYVKGREVPGVRKYDGTGSELGVPRDEAGTGAALAVAVGPADELYVNDLRERHHILTFDAAGEQTASFDAGGVVEDGERGIAYSQHVGALYVLNEARVRIVSPPPPGPLILEGSVIATEVAPTTATLEATVNPEGAEPTTYHFEYGTTAGYGESTVPAALEGGPFEDQSASANIGGLAPGTTYHFRVVAENAAKEVTDGSDQTFTTLPPVSIDATSASEVDATSARLEAELNPHGLTSEYRFEYGLTSAYGESVPIPDGSAGSGSTDTTVSNLVQGLLPSTTYHYRVIAHNALNNPGEVVEGPDRTFTTQGPASILADGRAWELVSPVNKHGAPLEPLTEEGGLIQAAANGGGLTYVALGPVNGTPEGVRSPINTQLLSARTTTGWETRDITTRHEEISIIQAGFPSEYKFFADDLQSGVVEPQGITRLSEDTTERTPYRREASGAFVPLVTSSNVLPGVPFGGEETEPGPEPGGGVWAGGVEFLSATLDLGHAVLASPQPLTPGFSESFEPEGRPNLYELAGGALSLVSVLPGGEPAAEAGLPAKLGRNNLNMRGAISSDGDRVIFETGASEHLYLRDVGLAQTVRLDEVEPGASGGAGAPTFQAASSDGGRIFFTDVARLTTDATAKPGKPDLYMCEVDVIESHVSCALSDLSVDPNPGEAANVQGEVSAIDATGGHVYFAANGALTSTANAHGETAVPGVCNSEGEAPCNLYEYDTGARRISLVAVLSSHDDPDWAGRTNLRALGNLTARSSPGGRYFTFMSQRSLTGYDNRDSNSGQPDQEVFLFDASNGELSCVSCNPTGARPTGVFDKPQFPGLLVDHPQSWGNRWLAGSVPGWTLLGGGANSVALYQSRYLSDGGRLFFTAADGLVPQDTNKVEDVYEFEPPGVGDCASSSSAFSASSGGCVNLISSGSSKEESAFLDASESGDEAFFLTGSRLVGDDVDGALDVYDAHVCSASSPCPPPPAPPPAACQGDACQTPSSPPNDATPSSLTYKGPGNAAAPAPATKAKSPTRAQLLARALKACRKQPRKKRVACERRARKKYGNNKKRPKAGARAPAKRAGHRGSGGGR
jgi:hypothetical protein